MSKGDYQKNPKSKLLGQRKSGAWLGGVKIVIQSAMFYLTAVNFLLLLWLNISNTAYDEIIRDFMTKHMPWFNFPIFMGILFAFMLVAMYFEYKYVIPSSWKFQNWQWYEHGNPMRTELGKMEKRLDKRLEVIEKKLGNVGKGKPK
jgi:hypothetical protein